VISIIILAISGIVHLIYFGRPSSVVFDEVFYGNFTSSYWQGSYFFDAHPHFVKILFAFVGKIFHLDQFTVNWSSIGNSLPISIVELRIIPILFGILLPLIIYLICRKLDLSKTSAFVAGILICLENSLIVQSRYLLPDIIMLVFGFSAILFYLEYRKKNGTKYQGWLFAISTLCAGITLSIKWTGLTFLFLIITMEVTRLLDDRIKFKSLFKGFFIFILKYLSISIIIYLSLFAIHFAILKNSGQGDVFMSLEFRKDLIGSVESRDPNLKSLNFWQKFTELNRVMFTSNSGMTATHPYSSKWYTWPIMQRSIFYWQDNNPATPEARSYIYLLGNPFIYWLGTLSILSLIMFTLYSLVFKKTINPNPRKSKVVIFLIVGFLVNFLPYMLIGRVMFLYHYETALIFSIFAIVFWIDFIKGKKLIYISTIIIILALSFFLYFSPLTYGIPLTEKQLNSRMWLPSWR